MANQRNQHTGITIRLGAAYDQVEVQNKGKTVATYDRSKMRKDGKPEMQGALRRQVVDVWAKMQEGRQAGKQSRASRIAGQKRDKARRERA